MSSAMDKADVLPLGDVVVRALCGAKAVVVCWDTSKAATAARWNFIMAMVVLIREKNI